MRNITLLLFLILILVGCNNKNEILDLPCENFFNESKDEFEKDLSYQSYTIFFRDSSEEIIAHMYFVSLDLKLFYIDLRSVQPICVDNNSKVIFLFNDESTTEYFVKSEPNCEGKVLIERPFISEFQNKTLKGFRIKTKDGYLDYFIDDNSKLELKKTASCFFQIANEKLNNK